MARDALEFLLADRLPPLGPGCPDPESRRQLEQLQPADLLEGRAVADPEMARLCLAGLWLYHDFLDDAHRICQEVATPSGSYWHAIVHRREPDAWNSRYWFRRVGAHPVLDRLRAESAAIGCPITDPSAFIDLVERVRGTGSEEEEQARRVQLLEWRLLFDHCRRAAAGSG